MRLKKVIAIYIRLSIEDADVKRNDYKSESNSISNQKTLIYDFIEKIPDFQGIDTVVYKDDGYTGTDFERPQYLEMMKAVRAGKIAAIVVKDFSRLGRDYLDAGNFLDKIFPAYGIRFVSINDGYDSNNHIGQTAGIDVGFKNVVNELYSKDTSVKNRSAQMVRMKRGEYTFAYPFYGYRKNPEKKRELVIDSVAADHVRRIFAMSIDGMSTYDIAKTLNDEGVLSPYEYKKSKGHVLNSPVSGDKALWNSAKIKAIIRDERYTGKMILHKHERIKVGSKKTVAVPKDEWVVVNDTQEAIVSQEEYEAACSAMDKRVKRAGIRGTLKRKSLFYCPYCKHKLQRKGGGKDRKYLYCSFARVSGNENCESIYINREELEQAVVTTMNMMGNLYLDAAKEKAAFKRDGEKYEIEIKKCESRLNEIKTRRRNEYMRMKEGILIREAYIERMTTDGVTEAELEDMITKLTDILTQEEKKREELNLTADQVNKTFFISKYDEEILGMVINKIFVDKAGKIEISLKNKDFQDVLQVHSS